MLNERALKCLKGIIEKINSIDRICKENGGVVKALEKELPQSTIMLYMIRIQEQFKKLPEIYSTLIPTKITDRMKKSRDIAAHDYDSVNFSIIENIIHSDLPKIKSEFTKILEKNKQLTPQEKLSKEIKEYEKNKNNFYQEAKLKKEKIILELYEKLIKEDKQIDPKELKIIETIQKSHSMGI